MASGYKVNGVDLDSIFEPRTTSKIADVGYDVNGVDISNRYEKLASGSAAAATGYLTGGSDLNTKFAKKGTVTPPMTSVTVNKTTLHKGCVYPNSGGYCSVTTQSVTATPVGGEGHTYQWEKVSGTTMLVDSPTSATTTFSRTSGSTGTGIYRCKVTSVGGTVKYSAQVTVKTDHTYMPMGS